MSSRFDGELTRGRKLDLWTVAERLLRAEGVARVERVDLCTICHPELFFSHRRDGKPRGVQGVLGTSPDAIRARLAEVQGIVGPGVTVVAATKYVSIAEMALLVEAGVTVVGENRAQDLEAKHAEYGDAFRWHFIGHLQSNKVKVVNQPVRARALARLTVDGAPARDPRARPGEPGGRGVEDRHRAGRPAAAILGPGIVGLSTMPPATADPEQSRPWFRQLRELAAAHGLAELSMGTTQDFAVAAAEEGATYVRVGSLLFRN